MSAPPAPDDVLRRLRLATQARIGLGRAGDALPTRALLDFQTAHAMARDAVHTSLRDDVIASGLATEPVVVASQAADRAAYLQRPDLGRRLDDASTGRLASLGIQRCDAVVVIADGLSATAVHQHGSAVASALCERLADWDLAPIVVAHQARVALADDIGGRIGASLAIILIGERPGLSAPDSLGAYITWQPRVGRMDSQRNCVSNIRPPHGLSYAAAADKIAWLVREARTLRLTGVDLKDEHDASTTRIGAPDQGSS